MFRRGFLLSRGKNLADLIDKAAARLNLGLASLAQALAGADDSYLMTAKKVHAAFKQFGLGGVVKYFQNADDAYGATQFVQFYPGDTNWPGDWATGLNIHRGGVESDGQLVIDSQSRVRFRFVGQNWFEFYHTGNMPTTATRWPSFGEVTGKPATYPASGHTHPWSQVTGKPATATRWPNWGEIGGRPATATRWPTWNEVSGKPANAVNTGAGQVGTYAFLYAVSGPEKAGETEAAGYLRYAGTADIGAVYTSSPLPNGTWRCMGYATDDQASLFLRIA